MYPANQTPTPYTAINRVLLDLHRRVVGILEDHLYGMYLYGSLATGGFEPARSDIDFVVITKDQLDQSVIQSLETMHLRLAQQDDKWLKKLEGAYVPKAVIRRHDPHHPPVPTLNEGAFYMAQLGDDWVLQRSVLRATNCALSGPTLHEVIDPVYTEDIRTAIIAVIDHWWAPLMNNPSRLRDPGYQPYAVLSMCRILYTMHTGELATKSQAAAWALETLPEEWSPLIQHALHWGDGGEIESIERTKAFMGYAIELCR